MNDWSCQQCSFLNNSVLEYCEICDYPNETISQTLLQDDEPVTNIVAEIPVQAPILLTTNAGNNYTDTNTDNFSLSTSYWVCGICEYKFNMYDDHKCLMCDRINNDLPTHLLLRRHLYCDWNRGSSYVEIFKHNIVVYRKCLDNDSQLLLLNDCNDKLHRIHMPGLAPKTKPGPTHGFSYQTGWMPGTAEDKKEGDPSCLQLATNLHHNLIHELHDDIVDINLSQPNTELHIPDKFEAHSLWARQYLTSQGLGFHLDPPGCEWVFIVSLGCDTHYQVYGRDENEGQLIDLVLKSGDAIFFNGTNVYHSIKNIIDGTQPKWWGEQEYHRVGLQMRGHLGAVVVNRIAPKPKRRR